MSSSDKRARNLMGEDPDFLLRLSGSPLPGSNAYSAGYYDGVHSLPFNPTSQILPRTSDDQPDRIVARLYQRFARWAARGFTPDSDGFQDARADVTDLLRSMVKAERNGWMSATHRRYPPGSLVEFRFNPDGKMLSGRCEITTYEDYGVCFKPALMSSQSCALSDIEFRPLGKKPE
ncbi:hypothetical protein [Marinobacter salicampi]|uniref:hypothetical protein n=1 Tax=Marinobacter salicampi TaxID=435907 RepID=UPI00140C065D|nr:hypothetical protein [Marinobacter salicampi]